MIEPVLVDTGPLVAILKASDQHHGTCVAAAQELPHPFLTTWPVITEAAWLLRRTPDGVANLIGLLEAGLVRCHDLDAGFPGWLKSFLHQYTDLGPQLADASLVYLAGLYNTDKVFTLDRRDFQAFRTKSGKPFRLLPETL